MNVTEIRKLIRQSEDESWYNSLITNIKYPHANAEFQLSGLDSIYQFFEKQFSFFNNNEPLPDILKPSKSHFQQSVEKIETYVHRNLINKRGNSSGEWNQLKSFLEKDVFNNQFIFNKESETTDFLLKLDSEYEGSSSGAYDFFTNQNFQYNNSDKNYFIGWHRAYEFFTHDVDFKRRRDNERRTLSRVRKEYIENLLKNDKSVSDHISEKENEYHEKERAISRLIRKKNTQYESWKSDSQNSFQAFLDNSNRKIEGLEALYKEKLKLEAPAQYWKLRAGQLKIEGRNWLIGLIASSIIAIVALGLVLFFISDGTLKELFSGTGSAIRWSIVFVTFMSFLAYAIRTFAKLTFSAYHLYRDAEEREQLAYVYLALKKEQNIDDTERHLIMQSLFSRADSGLLKDDSSPTMPGGSIVEKMFGGK